MDMRDGSLPTILLRAASDIHGKYLGVAFPNVSQGTILHSSSKLAGDTTGSPSARSKPSARESSAKHFNNYKALI